MDGRFLVGLIGANIGTSMSPALHEREAGRHGVRYLYQLIDPTLLGLDGRDIGELITAARRLGFRGLNITHPYKQDVVKHLDELSPEAALLGAVNTVLFDGERATGHNTDRYGFAQGLARRLPDVATGHVVQVGAGGAGAAVASAIAGTGTRLLTLADLDSDRANRLARAIMRSSGTTVEVIAPADVSGRLRQADGLVNATPLGMEGHPGMPVPADHLRPEMWVADVIYRPLETELIRAARHRGCRVADGGGMVVYQAAASFRLFTGLTPDEERMYADFEALAGPRHA
ncbi:shikimate dehydrogenase (NADP(+)) [Paractinoplanes deccanensis]|uniref:Shikimate dehydrogenase (NADP(+)) n=1 Tax=Paractinoplanes deccanensis TaxID=113561 RepID=A0ABQ3YA77_9ACTN|nr:shikimate dehydrogenase [Actinoplanes deccanensis]GID76922.1 shikimate dehydrogenase (NADP(+)) [Actinoplanes deccanensis]